MLIVCYEASYEKGCLIVLTAEKLVTRLIGLISNRKPDCIIIGKSIPIFLVKSNTNEIFEVVRMQACARNRAVTDATA
jgi:hypothetical protein